MAREIAYRSTIRTYLKIGREGTLITSSKEPLEGYEQVELKNGGYTYIKSFAGTDYGKITSVRKVEKNFPTGKVLNLEIIVTCDDTGNQDVIQLEVTNSKGNLSDELRKFISIMPEIDYSKTYTISSNTKKSESGYIDKLLFVIQADENGETSILKTKFKFGEGGDVPMFEKTQDPLSGGVKYDFSKQDAFLINVLNQELERAAKDISEVKSAGNITEIKEDEKPKMKYAATPEEAFADDSIKGSNTDDDNPFV